MNFFKNTKYRISSIKKMLILLWQNDKKFLAYIMLDILLNSGIPFIGMYLTKTSVDILTQKGVWQEYIVTIIILLINYLFMTLIQSFVAFKTGVMGNLVGDKLFANIFDKTMNMEFENLLNRNILEKRELAMKVIENGSFNNLVNNFKQFISNIFIVMGVISVVAKINIWILLLIVLIIIINSYATSVRKKTERVIYVESVPVNRKITYFERIVSDFSYGKEIRLYNMMDALHNKHAQLLLEIRDYLSKVLKLNLKSTNIYQVTNFLIELVIYLSLGYKIIVKNLITIGDFSLYLNATKTFNNAVQNLVASYIDIDNNGQYLNDYFEFMKIEDAFKEGKKFDTTKSSINIIFENVSFSYPGQKEKILRNVNFNIHSNEKISIVGENGAGKTTLIKLLLRLYKPTEGRILLNRININDMDYDNYLSLFSAVFQDYKLFAFTVAENITSLRGEITIDKEDEITTSLIKAGIYEKIYSQSKNIHTYLYNTYEENGIELSGGESQKLAIARAFYKDSPIIVMDEPTAALDPKAEYDIYMKISNLIEGKTALFISHRLSSTRFCDKILVLKEGEIIETGTHEELLSKNGYYSKLYNLQSSLYK